MESQTQTQTHFFVQADKTIFKLPQRFLKFFRTFRDQIKDIEGIGEKDTPFYFGSNICPPQQFIDIIAFYEHYLANLSADDKMDMDQLNEWDVMFFNRNAHTIEKSELNLLGNSADNLGATFYDLDKELEKQERNARIANEKAKAEAEATDGEKGPDPIEEEEESVNPEMKIDFVKKFTTFYAALIADEETNSENFNDDIKTKINTFLSEYREKNPAPEDLMQTDPGKYFEYIVSQGQYVLEKLSDAERNAFHQYFNAFMEDVRIQRQMFNINHGLTPEQIKTESYTTEEEIGIFLEYFWAQLPPDDEMEAAEPMNETKREIRFRKLAERAEADQEQREILYQNVRNNYVLSSCA